MDPIPSCAELRAQITLDRPTRQDLERVHATMGARAMAAARIRQTSKDAGRLVLLASEQRDVDAHQAAIGELANLAAQLEPRVPMRPEDRKMRFGSPHLPGATADYSRLRRLSREHSVTDWARRTAPAATATTPTRHGRRSARASCKTTGPRGRLTSAPACSWP
jgi:hypothetical protein